MTGIGPKAEVQVFCLYVRNVLEADLYGRLAWRQLSTGIRHSSTFGVSPETGSYVLANFC